MDHQQTDLLIREYFNIGLQQNEILQFLKSKHGINISLRTLKRCQHRLRLFRRRNYSDFDYVHRYISNALTTSAQMHGYRWLHLKCIQMGLIVTQDVVRRIIKQLDPEGVEFRTRRRLRRRQYWSRGPNYVWHMDSYDKLKRYGICINGCVDGFSRHIIWLRASSSSSDPKVIANYYLTAVVSLGGCPVTMRSDNGTENAVVAGLQMIFCDRFRNADNQRPAHLWGRSTANQRIESWWSILRKENAQFWINVFEFLRDEGLHNGTYLDKALTQFCFMDIIQKELQDVAFQWNTHRIRRSRNTRGPVGRPLCMFEVPETYGTRSYLVTVPQEVVHIIMEDSDVVKNITLCDNDVMNLCNCIMEENNWSHNNHVTAAVNLYTSLRQEVLNVLEKV